MEPITSTKIADISIFSFDLHKTASCRKSGKNQRITEEPDICPGLTEKGLLFGKSYSIFSQKLLKLLASSNQNTHECILLITIVLAHFWVLVFSFRNEK